MLAGLGWVGGVASAQAERIVRIENTVDERNVVEIAVTGDARRADDTEDADVAREGYIRSVLTDASAYDEFAFTGDIEAVEWSTAEPVVLVDGRPFDPDGGNGNNGDQRLRIENVEDSRNVVTVAVSGSARRVDDTEDADAVEDGVITSVLTDATAADVFGFTGEITCVDWSDHEPVMRVDGAAIDPGPLQADDCGGNGGPRNGQTLRIDNTVGEFNIVLLQVSGAIQPRRNIERSDRIDDGTVWAVLTDRTAYDVYAYTGDIECVSWSTAPPRLRHNGNTVDPGQFDQCL